ncbi:SusC/RagA family TonB-linked outer membrane protein [Hymenobacter nivis]|uniref:SusC/RagA family TonB-linked outer membrane protein n=1 Tax=Hymenobacter nivis TaxID=1850093 RepID=A0A2Z3GNX4_9BACT|nr:TonB-dependent receptor [Hymenobacter nivis]AWM32665.1 SusC/RagA family TonB-linked outer membrane protein [Hymenobacter nivis]
MDPTRYFSTFRKAALVAACGLPALASLAAPGPLPGQSYAQKLVSKRPPVTVSGRVIQANGEALPGVTVLVKGTALGVSTDANGGFTLSAPEGSTLVFSYVGYLRREVAVTSASTQLNITLTADVAALNEVVVVGYGTQERGSVTGAISSVNGAELVRQPVADATQALQGKVSGVTITSNGGAPGGAAGTSVRIRGITSAGNNNPLYVVDGFPLPDNGDSQLSNISPNDIETIDVLKDASATAIYGVRAANGVVLITTKRGKVGKTSVNVDAYRGVQSVARRLDLLNAEQYAVINNEARIAAGQPIALDKLRNPAALGQGTDWQDLMFRRAKIQNYSLSATGGSEKARYALSGTYFQQDGVILGSNFERFTLRANGDVQLSPIFKIGNSISLTHSEDRQITSNNGEYGAVQQLLRMPPTVQPYRPDGYWYQPNSPMDNFTEENPLATSLRANQKFVRNRATTTFYAELEPVKGLRFRTNVGADLVFENFNQFAPKGPELAGYTQRYITAGAGATAGYSPSYLIENTATYDRTFAEKHHATLLVGQSAQEFNYSNVEAYRTGYLRNDLQTINVGPINTLLANAGTIDPARHLSSYFGRLNYDYAGKYIFQATARYDGSSRFEPGHKFGFFPSASVGWRISEEEFLKGNTTISNLKLRAGYGRVGNELNAGRFAYLYSINFGAVYPFGSDGTINTGGAPTRLSNPNLRWEYNDQANIGLEMGFLDNRIEATIDLYNRNSPNLIAPVPQSLVSGTYESVNSNAASAYNRGIDFSLTSHNFVGSSGALTWTTTFNISAYKTRLVSLGAGIPYNGPQYLSGNIVRYDAGHALGSFYGYVADGLIQSKEELNALNAGALAGTAKSANYQNAGTAPGDIKFRDLNGDGVITEADRTFIGNPNPNFTFGLTNTLGFKGFDLSFFIQGVQGNDIYNLNRYITENALYGTTNGTTNVLNRWTGTGTSNDMPRAIVGDPNNNLRISTHYIENGSYVRLKNLTFGYTLPRNLMGRVGASQLRVYVTAQNLVTLTKYTGYDPEVSASGIDLGIYPQTRVFMGGVNIGF